MTGLFVSIWLKSARAHTPGVNQKSEAKSWQTSDRLTGALTVQACGRAAWLCMKITSYT